MAGTATAAYSPDVWTSVDSTQQQWEYSVPIRQDSTSNRSKSRSSRDAKSRDRGSKESRSSSVSRHAYAHDQGQYASRGRDDAALLYREMETGSTRDSATGSHTNGLTKKGEANEGIGLRLDVDSANWIHRDKLARIESEELQQAAILFQRRPGTGSTRMARGRSRDQSHNSGGGSNATALPANEPLEPWPDLQEDQRNYASSPVPAGFDGSGDATHNERRNWDLRRPEEIAAEVQEDNASSIYRNPGLRKSSSRIPIPTSSPVPLSPENTDHEFSARSRTLTNGDDESYSFGMARRASEPITVESLTNSSAASESRPGSRGVQATQTSKKVSTKPTSGSTNRKTSVPPTSRKTTNPRSRTASNNNSTQRPPTRGGEGRPPTAVNRPEGDPPWLATMYKPDPRLPPDQQMLPTHARKLQQEQWAREGKTPTTYDREFAPLAIAPDPPAIQDTVKKEDETVEEKGETQPHPPSPVRMEDLGLSSIPKSPESGTRPSTSTGYSPMPKVQEPPQAPLTPRFKNKTTITAENPHDDKVDKGCGCCIVM